METPDEPFSPLIASTSRNHGTLTRRSERWRSHSLLLWRPAEDVMKKGKVVGVAAASAVLLGIGYVGMAWLRYGKGEAQKTRSDSLLDRFMPHYEIREFHETRVAAPAEVAFAVARELDMQESGVVRAIFKGRELFMGADRSNRRRPQPF